MFLHDDEIERLITCPKQICKKPRRNMAREGRHLRNDFDCEEVGGPGLFHVFMRQHAEFPENFSIGLNYSPEPGGDSQCLFRCNGPHEEAFVYFVNTCSILYVDKYFPFLKAERERQLRLFEEEDE